MGEKLPVFLWLILTVSTNFDCRSFKIHLSNVYGEPVVFLSACSHVSTVQLSLISDVTLLFSFLTFVIFVKMYDFEYIFSYTLVQISNY